LIPQAIHSAQHASHEALTGIDTGFSDLNGLTRGWQPTDLIVLAARPGFGKTALALQFAVAAARHRGDPVLIFSLEMSQAQLVMRMLCAEGRVNAYDLRQHDADQRLWGAFMNAGERLHHLPISINDRSSLSVLEVHTQAKRLQMDRGLAMMI